MDWQLFIDSLASICTSASEKANAAEITLDVLTVIGYFLVFILCAARAIQARGYARLFYCSMGIVFVLCAHSGYFSRIMMLVIDYQDVKLALHVLLNVTLLGLIAGLIKLRISE